MVMLHKLREFPLKRWAALVHDLLWVPTALFMGYWTHANFRLMAPPDYAGYADLLPLVVAVQGVALWGFGLYRGIWRFAGTPEILRTIFATVLASVASSGLIAAMYGLASVSLGVMIIDWMMVTLAVIAVRFGFRGLRQYLASKGGDGKRALLYGAGEQGMLAIRILRHNDAMELIPIGFIDDNPLKVGLSVQGIPILGTGQDLREVCTDNEIDVVVVTANVTPRRLTEIITTLQPVEVEIQRLSVQLDAVSTDPVDAPRPSFSVIS